MMQEVRENARRAAVMDVGLDLTESSPNGAELGDLRGRRRQIWGGLGGRPGGWLPGRRVPGYSAVNLRLGRRLPGPQ